MLVGLLLLPACVHSQSVETRSAFPAVAKACAEKLGVDYAIGGKAPVSYLRGDFDGDGKPDYAVMVRKQEQHGVVVCLSSGVRRQLLGAGLAFHDMKDFNFDAWKLHPKSKPVERGVEESKPPRLRGDAILVEWEDSASALLYWNGNRFVWYQQGD